MRKNCIIAFVAFLAGTVCTLGIARSQPTPRELGTFEKTLAEASKLREDQVVALLNVLGPVISDQISSGKQVTIPGLGTYRVVQLEEQKNLVEGRVVTQPSTNVIEFLPEAGITRAANAQGAIPAVVIPAFQYSLLPDQTPSTKVPYQRTPSSRVR